MKGCFCSKGALYRQTKDKKITGLCGCPHSAEPKNSLENTSLKEFSKRIDHCGRHIKL
jgi:hypothetical protein